MAAWASALGASSRLICARGSDAAGELAAASSPPAASRSAGPSSTVAAGWWCPCAAREGERTMASDRGVAAMLEPSDLERSWLTSCDVLARVGLLPAARADGTCRRRGGATGPPSDRRPRIGPRHRAARRRRVRDAAGCTRPRPRLRHRGRAGRGARLRHGLGDQARARGARGSPRASFRPPTSRCSTPPAPATRSPPGIWWAALNSRSMPPRSAWAWWARCRDFVVSVL